MICDSCITAALEESNMIDDEDADEAGEFIARELGADIPDHNCDAPGECECGCRVHLARKRKAPARASR